MRLIVRLIANYALWIYILCGMGIAAYLRAAWQARREGMYEIFSLEQANAAKRVYRASWMILVLLLIVIGVYALSNYIELPPPQAPIGETPTPAAGETTTPKPTPSPTAHQPAPTLEPTATRRPRATTIVIPTTAVQGTPIRPPPPAQCPHANVQVTVPGRNQVIDAGVQVQGSAQKENFDRYEFKFQNRDIQDEWHWVETFTVPVENGDLGFWQTAHLPGGNYIFMLIAIDKMGNSQECTVPVVIAH